MNQGAPTDGRSALLDAIRQGAQLKHVSFVKSSFACTKLHNCWTIYPIACGLQFEGRNPFQEKGSLCLFHLRVVMQVDAEEADRPKSESGGDGLAGALARALAGRATKLNAGQPSVCAVCACTRAFVYVHVGTWMHLRMNDCVCACLLVRRCVCVCVCVCVLWCQTVSPILFRVVLPRLHLS